MPATDVEIERYKYPIGRFTRAAEYSSAEVAAFVDGIEALPVLMRQAVGGLDEAQLDTPYRPGGWTVRQVTHHVPDSHINAYVRMKLALTEPQPRILAYREELWALLADSDEPVGMSLSLLEALHRRWVCLLRSLDGDQWRRAYVHPELGVFPMQAAVALYDWHGRHPLAHVTELKRRQGWD